MPNADELAVITAGGQTYRDWKSVMVRRDYGNAVSIFSFVQDGPGRASPVAAWWAMRHSRIALTAVLALALAGCAMTPSRPLDYPPGAFYTPDGKPKVLPCMAGGLLCSPQG